MQLVLFDIDGTLINAGRAGADAMNRAFADIYQMANAFAGIDMSGKTDRSILFDVLTQHGIPPSEQEVRAFQERYIPYLQQALQQPERPRRLMPGLPRLLDVMAVRDDILPGLLTGNVARGAQLKLESFGIWHYFSLGAYGSDHRDRNRLVPIAQQRAQEVLGQEITSAQTVVIGDTPRDIVCAQVHGARAIAVATGRYRQDDLQAYQPDACLADLSDIDAVMRLISSP